MDEIEHLEPNNKYEISEYIVKSDNCHVVRNTQSVANINKNKNVDI